MKGGFLLMLMMSVLFSCSLVELGRIEKDVENGVWAGPAGGQPSQSVRSTVYVTGFDYPEGYDWHSDVEHGSVKCSLVVFSDGLPVLKVPVGETYKVSSDPDMHRVIDGHLYTDYSSGSETVVKKDGKPLFTFPAAESVCAMHVLGDSVHTLGLSRSGQGFSYRVSGQPVLMRQNGYPFEHLIERDGSMSFAFCETIRMAEGSVERYYSVCDGVVTQVAVRDDLKKVWDISHRSEGVVVLASLTGISAPVLLYGREMTALQLPSGSSVVTCRIVHAEKTILVEGVVQKSGALMSVLWKDGAVESIFDKGMTVSAICASEDGTAHCVLNPPAAGGSGLIFRGDEKMSMPEGYVCMNSCALTVSDGFLYAGLSPLRDGRPVLWADGKMQEYDLNGFICTVTTRQETVY